MRERVLLAARAGGDAERLQDGLQALEMAVSGVSTGADALAKVEELRPDVVLLVLDLPDVHGLDVCRRLRRSSDVPLIVVGGDEGELERVLVLELGADDFIAQPCDNVELCERIRAALRRARGERSPSGERAQLLEIGPIAIDRSMHTLSVNGHRRRLTPMEVDLLWTLASRAGQVVRSEDLLREVWGYPRGVRTRTLDVHIGRLRRKLGEDGQHQRHIITVRGVGYRFEAEPEDGTA